MVDTGYDSNSRRQVDRSMGNAQFLSHDPIGGPAIAAENRILSQDGPQRRFNRARIGYRQLEIRRRSGTIPYHQHRYLVFTGTPRMNRMTALSRRTAQMALPFAGVRKIRFVRLGDPLQSTSFGLGGHLQESMPPTKAGVLMDAAAGGRLADR